MEPELLSRLDTGVARRLELAFARSVVLDGGGEGVGEGVTTSGERRICCTVVVRSSPMAANSALIAVSSDVAVARTPVDSAEAAKLAPFCVAEKISAVTITEPPMSVRRTALVLTSAWVARTVLMAVRAAAS